MEDSSIPTDPVLIEMTVYSCKAHPVMKTVDGLSILSFNEISFLKQSVRKKRKYV